MRDLLNKIREAKNPLLVFNHGSYMMNKNIAVNKKGKISNRNGKFCIRDLRGIRFSRLIVTDFLGERETNNGRIDTIWKCKCDCGNTTTSTNNHLVSGDFKSCGCLNKEYKSFFKIHGMKKTSFWLMWKNLRARCNNPNDNGYKNYGGRGITYDLQWEKFLNFRKDMYWRYLYAKRKYTSVLTKTNVLSIERIDVNGNYCKENCTFIPRNEQNKNKRNNKWFKAKSPEGKIYIAKVQVVFAKKHNLKQNRISTCLNKRIENYNGWCFEFIK